MIREPIPCPLNCPLTAKRPIFNAGYEDRLFELGMLRDTRFQLVELTNSLSNLSCNKLK